MTPKNETNFLNLLEKTITSLKESSGTNFIGMSPTDFEKVVQTHLENCAKGSEFEDGIELVSGKSFPDIVVTDKTGKKWGVEVKTSKDKWNSTGSSINESTRVDDIENVYILFGKLKKPVDFKTRLYQEALSEVRVTHYPRYIIDMELPVGESFFDKIGVDYNDFRKADDTIKQVKRYYSSQLKPGEELWWIDSDTELPKLTTWSSLQPARQEELLAEGYLLFPELIQDGGNDKYVRFANWLVSKNLIVCPNVRDQFTAGGMAVISGIAFPKGFTKLLEHLEHVQKSSQKIKLEEICYYWKIKTIKRNDLLSEWIKCLDNNIFVTKKTPQKAKDIYLSYIKKKI